MFFNCTFKHLHSDSDIIIIIIIKGGFVVIYAYIMKTANYSQTDWP